MEEVYVVFCKDYCTEEYFFKDKENAIAFAEDLNSISDHPDYSCLTKSFFEGTNRYITFYVSVEVNCPQNIVTEFFGVHEGLAESEATVFVGDIIIYSFVQVPYIKGADLKKMAIDKFKKALEGTK